MFLLWFCCFSVLSDCSISRGVQQTHNKTRVFFKKSKKRNPDSALPSGFHMELQCKLSLLTKVAWQVISVQTD